MDNLNEQILRAKELMGILNEGKSSAALHNTCMKKILEKDYGKFRAIDMAGHYGGGDAGAPGIGACGRHLYELMTDKKYATNAPTYEELIEYGEGKDRNACGRAIGKVGTSSGVHVKPNDIQEIILDNWGCWVKCIKEVIGHDDSPFVKYRGQRWITDYKKRKDGEDKCNWFVGSGTVEDPWTTDISKLKQSKRNTPIKSPLEDGYYLHSGNDRIYHYDGTRFEVYVRKGEKDVPMDSNDPRWEDEHKDD